MHFTEATIAGILITLLTILAGGLGFIIKEQREKIKTIQNQLSEKKYKVYHEIYSIFFDLLKQQKGIQNKNDSNLVERLIDIKKDLFIYAPDKICKKFIEWLRFMDNKPGDTNQIVIFLDICVLVRKDMGQSKTKITNLDLLRSIMISDEEYEKFIKTIPLDLIMK